MPRVEHWSDRYHVSANYLFNDSTNITSYFTGKLHTRSSIEFRSATQVRSIRGPRTDRSDRSQHPEIDSASDLNDRSSATYTWSLGFLLVTSTTWAADCSVHIHVHVDRRQLDPNSVRRLYVVKVTLADNEAHQWSRCLSNDDFVDLCGNCYHAVIYAEDGVRRVAQKNAARRFHGKICARAFSSGSFFLIGLSSCIKINYGL